MNKEQRLIYRDVINVSDYGLCNFCKYAAWSGYSCCEADLSCEHPVNSRYELVLPSDPWSGGDCWMFRPDRPLADIAAYCSIAAEGNRPHRNRKGELVAIIPSENDKKYWA